LTRQLAAGVFPFSLSCLCHRSSRMLSASVKNRRGVVNERVIQERRSEPSWPRVMRGQPRGCHRSVDRGKCRQGIELRNNRDRSADAVQHSGRQHRRVRNREHLLDSAQSETPRMHGNSVRGNRETPSSPIV
jgi:hypothetical protein